MSSLRRLKPGFRTAVLLAAIVSSSAARAQTVSLTQGDGWYLPTADKACRLYVREIGSGPPVVVLHGGFGAEYSYLLNAVSGLTGKYHFIFYDQRGSLRSPCKLDAVSFKAHVEDLETLRQSLNLDKLSLFAHSKGTLLAAEYIKEHPDHVGKVALAGALPMKGGTFLGPNYPKMLDMDSAATLMVDRPEVQAEKARLSATEPAGPKRDTHIWHVGFAAANIDHIDRWPQMEGGQVFYAQHGGDKASTDLYQLLTDNFDFSDDFRSHPGRITIISGDHDYADWHNVFFREFEREVPLHLVILKDAGHSAWIDDPKGFRTALDKALRP